MKKNNHGGRREGAGAPKKEPTKVLTYRVPAKKAARIDKAIRKTIAAVCVISYSIKQVKAGY